MNFIEEAKKMAKTFLSRIHNTSAGTKSIKPISSNGEENSVDSTVSIEYINISTSGITSSGMPGAIYFGSDNRFRIEVDINIPQKYIDTVALDDILKSLDEFMDAVGFEYESKEEPIYGSFFQKLMFFAKSDKTQKQAISALEMGKVALQANYLNKPIADATAQLSNSAASLISSCAGVDEIVIRAGILILVKTTVDGKAKMMVETISPQLMIYLDENPGMLRAPSLIYHFLEQLPEQLKRANGNYSNAFNAAGQITFGKYNSLESRGLDAGPYNYDMAV